MKRPRLLIVVARTCFRPAWPITLIGVSTYVAYLVWLATYEIGLIGAAAYVHLGLALATAGAWIGAYVGRLASWSGARFIPSLGSTLAILAGFGAVSALVLNSMAAWLGGIGSWSLAPFGVLAVTAGLVSGQARPGSELGFFLCLGILIPLEPLLDPVVAPLISGAKNPASLVVVLGASTALLVWFVCRLRASRVGGSLSQSSTLPSWATTTRLPNRLREPSMARIAVVAGVLATGCTIAYRHPAFEWRDSSLIVMMGSVCAILGATGKSASHLRGPLPGAARLLLLGAAKDRYDAARRMLLGIVANSFFACGVFTAVTIALGPEWHLVEMMLVTLAACHAYLTAACPSRWLLSRRLSGVVAAPTVVAFAWAAWAHISWALPTAFAACLLTGVAAVYLGGIGMARIDLDPVPLEESVR